MFRTESAAGPDIEGVIRAQNAWVRNGIAEAPILVEMPKEGGPTSGTWNGRHAWKGRHVGMHTRRRWR